ncbi:hypothetical protein E5673_12910 [Sphingomonas sp. PAMC26645]|uniref:hypothetical protein n=1 Tax=Sphingomonas sp. PAMC26645 TaxID=2565555 RepID=UPI00109E3489|nr:hypothetical protein [Sphingomonas sp. PAMC26645]QCB43007.1 hypothetical protein E5673_12910 [Sphingomonas sp. PAMC26645]
MTYSRASATAPSQPDAEIQLLFNAPSKHRSVAPSGVSWADEQLRLIAMLPNDWDGYGAAMLSIDRLSQISGILAEHFAHGLPAGSVVPGADGSIQLEWHFPKMSFGFSVEDDGSLYSWARTRDTGHYVDSDGGAAVTLLQTSALQALV